MIAITRLREALNFSPEKDEELALIKQMVIDLWEEQTSMLWNARTAYVELFRNRNFPRPKNLLLEVQPVTTITTVETRAASSGSEWVELGSTNYILLGRRQLELLSGTWSELVRITYDGGASSADEDVQKALIVQAQFMLNRMGDDKISVSAQNFRGGAGTLEQADFHPFFKAMAESKGTLI